MVEMPQMLHILDMLQILHVDRGDSRHKRFKSGRRDAEIQVRSVRFTPEGFDKIAKIVFATFGYECTDRLLCGSTFVRIDFCVRCSRRYAY